MSNLNMLNHLYNKLTSIGVDTLIDDRKETIGVKFTDTGFNWLYQLE